MKDIFYKVPRSIRKLLDSWKLFMIVAAYTVLYIALTLWPVSYWLEVTGIEAGPAVVGEVVPMSVNRTVNSEFKGDWSVTVRKFSSAGWIVYCSAYGSTVYRTDAALPGKLDLDWWTEGACPVIDHVGSYMVATTWNITPSNPFVPEKSLTVYSNIFKVVAK